MSHMKIKYPEKLPQEGVSEAQFTFWKDKLEVYLNTEEKFHKFLPGGSYSNWTSAEDNPNQILTAIQPDTDASLPRIRRELKAFITTIGDYVHLDYYHPISRHSTSLEWIYKKIRQDYNLELQGIHFLNLLDLQWDPTGNNTPIGFYNKYRSLIIGNLKPQGTRIQWLNHTLERDEKLLPSHEDLIFLNVLQLLHPKLPAYIRTHYAHKIGKDLTLMDFKQEILGKCKEFIQDIENPPIVAAAAAAAAAASTPTPEPDEMLQCSYIPAPIQRNRNRPQFFRPPFQQNYRYRPRFQPASSYRNQQPFRYQQPSIPYQPSSKLFCRLCQATGKSNNIVYSHHIGKTCPSLSDKDKERLSTPQLNNIEIQDDYQAAMQDNGYFLEETETYDENEQVNKHTVITPIMSPTCNFIQPVPAQILTVQDQNHADVHLDLDSGANVSFCKLDTVRAHGFKINPNGQLSRLADGKTPMEALGEVDEIFFRNQFQVRFHAIVTKDLHTDFIAGNNFIKENKVIQDFDANTITVHKKYTVPETSRDMILPTQPNNLILSNNHIDVLLPGGELRFTVPHLDETMLAVQPYHQNKQDQWPLPQLCQVKNNTIYLQNSANFPVNVKNTKIQVRTLSDAQNYEPNIVKCHDYIKPEFVDNTPLIQINKKNIEPSVLKHIEAINNTYKDVFDENLDIGYNHSMGKHFVKLNWANETRPDASKVQMINYDHDQKVLLQNVIDELTHKNVLAIPQDYNINIQHCSPAFLVRKGRAKNKAAKDLTTADMRLVCNFTKLNTYLKNIPTPVTKPRDIFSKLGRWNYLIVMDLSSGFFQNHMDKKDFEWLGISSPFGGMRFLKRSGQGLIGMSEQLDELLCKVIGNEMKEGIVDRIADDIFVGGKTAAEAANNYARVLKKFQQANIKISASKTKVFLESTDILGWTWHTGGFLSPSPHRVNALRNTKYQDIKNIKDLRSWLGLYKTLLPASPQLTLILHPFDLEVADAQSKDPVHWTRDLIHHFIQATKNVENLQRLYLPAPSDLLLIETDAARMPPGIGHTVYAIKDDRKLPVTFHSAKLSDGHQKWNPCELEALAISTAIQAEFNLLKEAKNPTIICTDSKPVHDAIKLIRKGNYSTNPRIQALLTNINRVPITVRLVSGKLKHNQSSDLQSRNPSSCSVAHCSVCIFVQDSSSSILLPSCNSIGMPNRLAWKKIQDEQKSTREAKSHLKSGKTPSNATGKLNSEIKRLCKFATVNKKDDVLIVKSQPTTFSSIDKELIVIPSSHLPALLWNMHNTLQHPSKSQLKAQFDKQYYSVGLTPNLEKIYEDCFYCSTQKKIPSTAKHETLTEVTTPGTVFHADVIKRQGQKIFVVRDHFSTLTAATIVRSENHADMKTAIIELIMPIKLHGETIVKVDNATSFLPLIDKKDPELNKLQITVIMTDVFNKNENSCVDRACSELETELKRVEPDGTPISRTTLHLAICRLNTKLRRNNQLSAYEIHFNRDMYTGSNLNLDYEKIRSDQLNTRNKHNAKYNEKLPSSTQKPPAPGDVVIIKNKTDKHKANDVFLVSSTSKDKIGIQKIIHPHTEDSNLRSKVYYTKPSYLHVAKRHHQLPSPPLTSKPNIYYDESISEANKLHQSDSESSDNEAFDFHSPAPMPPPPPPSHHHTQITNQEIVATNDNSETVDNASDDTDSSDDLHVTSYHCHIRHQKRPAPAVPTLYQELAANLDRIQQNAKQSRHRSYSQSQPAPPTTPPPSTPRTPRAAKARSKYYIPQTDGGITNSEDSSDQQLATIHPRQSETDPRFLDARDSISIATDWDYTDLSMYPEDVFPTSASLAALDDSFITGSIDNYSPSSRHRLHQHFSYSLPNLSQNDFDNYTRITPLLLSQRGDAHLLQQPPF